MHIETDIPIRLTEPADVFISTTTAGGQHTASPLDYETFIPDTSDDTVTMKCYDGHGTAVCIKLTQRLILEMAFGMILEPGDWRARR